MFCKNCGKRIKMTDSACPWCGKDQNCIEGGNGFWDIVERQGVAAPLIDKAANSERNEAPVKPKKNRHLFGMCALFVSAIALAACIGGLLQIAKLKGTITQMMESFNLCEQKITEMSDEISSLNDSVNFLLSNQNADEDGTADGGVNVVPVSSGIIITKQPTDETVSPGQSTTVFIVAADGDSITFSWEKLDKGSNEWKPIDKEGDQYRVTEEGQTSRLAVNNPNSDVMGTYRCTVTDKDGVVIRSNEVKLTIAEITSPAFFQTPDLTEAADNPLAGSWNIPSPPVETPPVETPIVETPIVETPPVETLPVEQTVS